MKYANVKFNNGSGALLCDGCSVIIAYGHDHEDKLHFCTDCSDVMIQNMMYLRDKICTWKDQNNEKDI